MTRVLRRCLLIAAVLLLGLAPAPTSAAEPPAASPIAAAIQRFAVPIGSSPVDGPATAKVTIVVFSDFQCPFCQKHAANIAELRRRYGAAVRVVFKNEPLPFHPRAEPAAQLALEAFARLGPKGFWRAHDQLFAQNHALEDSDLAALATSLGLDPKRTMKAVAERKHARLIEADLDLAEDVEARGTPTTYLNGRKLSGAQEVEEFATIIDAEIALANDLLARGVAPTKIYDELQKGAVSAAAPKKVAPPPVTAAQPSRGPATALVTIQMFGDFQCPHCARAQQTLARLEQEFGGKLRIVWRHMPLPMHPNARDASNAAAEAFAQKGAAGFWAMHDRLFAEGQGLERNDLRSLARDLGLDERRFDAALSGDRYAKLVDADARAAESVGIRGTPSFVVNGYLVEGAQPYPKLARIVRRALADAGAR